MALTQARAFGTHAGARYGSFAGRGQHPVDVLTQPRAFGAHAGGRYGAFSGKSGGTHPVDRLTQLRAFGAHSGARYGSFAGRAAEAPAPPSQGVIGGPPPRRIRFGRFVRREDEDDLLLILAAQIAAGLIH